MFCAIVNPVNDGRCFSRLKVSDADCFGKRTCFFLCGVKESMRAGRGWRCRSMTPVAATDGPLSGNAACGDVVAVPVVDGKRFYAHPGAGFGAVNEVVLADVDARMVAGAGNAEDHNVAGAQAVAGDALTGIGLIAADAWNADAVGGAGPVHESGAVEALGWGGSAEDVRATELTFGRGGDGCSAAAGHADLRGGIAVRTIGLFAAACGQNHGCTKKQQRKESGKGGESKCRHGCPADLSRYRFNILFVDHKEKKCKRDVRKENCMIFGEVVL